MSGQLPSVTAGQVVRAHQRAGFAIVRTSGSHHRLVHKDEPARATTVPVHSGRTLKRGTLHGIIKQAGLTVEEFRDLL
jgi:predicted RNA binding protein YcfA (HicA-like mRNA interferase family)